MKNCTNTGFDQHYNVQAAVEQENRQFSLRGLAAVVGEWCLVCLAWNLKRLHKLATT